MEIIINESTIKKVIADYIRDKFSYIIDFDDEDVKIELDNENNMRVIIKVED